MVPPRLGTPAVRRSFSTNRSIRRTAMKTLALILASTALCVSACKRSDDATATNVDTNAAMTGTEANMAAPTALAVTAQDFANAAAASDHFEIESSKLADGSAQSSAVKAFARQMITAHTASTAKLKATLAAMTPPMTADDTLNPDQQALLDGLKGKTGADFDAAYASAQTTAHQKTLDALNAYAGSGDNPQLMDFAKGLIPTVTAHLNLAQGLK
jgi:putative membrane protein